MMRQDQQKRVVRFSKESITLRAMDKMLLLIIVQVNLSPFIRVRIETKSRWRESGRCR